MVLLFVKDQRITRSQRRIGVGARVENHVSELGKDSYLVHVTAFDLFAGDPSIRQKSCLSRAIHQDVAVKILQGASRGLDSNAGDAVVLFDRRHGFAFHVFHAAVARGVEQYPIKAAPDD